VIARDQNALAEKAEMTVRVTRQLDHLPIVEPASFV